MREVIRGLISGTILLFITLTFGREMQAPYLKILYPDYLLG